MQREVPTPDAAEMAVIVAGLTKAQWSPLFWHTPGYLYGNRNLGWPQPARDPSSFANAGRLLMDLGLIAWAPDRKDSRTYLTPLGLAIRQILQKDQDDV